MYKKNNFFFLLLCVSILWQTASWAQVQPVASYTFSSYAGTYTPIVGGTGVTSAVTPADDNNYGPFAIGFPFYYGNTTTPFTQFSINANGFIGLGGTAVTSSYTAISSGTSNNIIAAFNQDIQAPAVPSTTDISYVVTGTAPNRVLTVQWTNFRRYNTTSGDDFDFQIQLYETFNTVQVVYGSGLITGGGTTTLQVGLRGTANSDYNNRTTTTDWAASTAGGANTANMSLTATVFPASGLTYTWNPSCAGGINSSGTLTLGSTAACAASASVLLTDSGYSGIVDFQISTDGGLTWTNTAPTNQTTTADVTQTITVTATTQIRAAVSCGGTIAYSFPPQTFTLTSPAATTITPSITGEFCNPPGASLNLTASSDPTYAFTWSTSATTATINVTPTATTTYTVTATDGICVSTANYTVTVTQAPSVLVTASPSPVCQYQTVSAQAVLQNNFSSLKITEVTAFHDGVGSTSPYPAYITTGLTGAGVNQDMVEITNLGNYPINIGGLVYEAWTTGGAAPQRSYTIPAGTIIAPNATLVLLLGSTGTASPGNLFFLAGGTNNVFGSSTAWGSLIKSGSTILDAVGLNSFVWPAASTVTAAQWTGNIASSTSTAGVRRTVATDSNAASDWTVAGAANLQNFGTINAGLSPITPYSFVWSTGATTAIATSTPTTVGTATYTVTVTNIASTCTSTATVNVTVNPASTAPTTNSPQSRCGAGTVSLTATSGTIGTFMWYNSSTATTALQTDPGVTASTYAPSVSSSTSFWVTFTDSAPGSCPSQRTEVVVTIVPPPALSITPSVAGAFCNPPGANLTLTANVLAGYTYSWTSNPAGFTGTGNTATVTPTATTTYTVSATDGTCNAMASYTVTVTNAPAVNISAANATICSGANDLLTVNHVSTLPTYCALAASSTIDDDIASVTFGSFTNNSPGWPGSATANAASTGTYTDYTALNAGTYAQGSSYPLTVTQFNSGISYDCYTNAFFDWNRDGDFADAGETFNLGSTSAGTTTTLLNITIPAIANGPVRMRLVQRESGTAANTGPCAPNSPTWGEVEDYTILVGTYTYAWSATTAGGVTAGGLSGAAASPSATNVTTTVAPTASGTSGTAVYTVTVTDMGTGCTSTATYTVTVNPNSLAPTATPHTRCGTGPAALVATSATAGTFTWYTVASGGTAAQTDLATTTSTYIGTVSATTDFWIEFLATGSTCPSPRVQVTETVTPAANITITPSVAGAFCNPIGATLDLTAAADLAGYSFTWDDGSTNAVRSLSSVTTTTTYTVTATAGACSNTASYTVNVNQAPVITATAAASTVCSGLNDVLTIAQTTAALPTYCALAASSTIDDDIASVTFGTFTNNSPGWPGAATANAASTGTYTDYTALNAGTYTQGSSYPLTVTQFNSGTSYGCYTNAFFDWNRDGDFADAGETFNLGSTSAGTTTTLLNITIPAIANGPVRMRLVQRESGTAANTGPCAPNSPTWGEVEDYTILVGTYTYAWSATTTGGVTANGLPGGAGTPSDANITVTATPIATANGTVTYTVTITDVATGCTNTASTTINVQITSPTPTMISSTQCGTNPANVQASSAVAGTFTWYNAATGGTLLQTDANALLSILTTSTSATTTYWVEFVETGGSCPAPRASAIATITASTPVTITGPTSSACSGTVNATLTASSANTGYTYTWSTGATTAAIIVTPTATTTYTVTATDGTCSALATYTVTVTAPPSITASAVSTTACSGQNLALSISPASYLVSTPNFFTETPPATTNAGPTGDDSAQGLNNIGFTFNYFGTNFTQFGISTNGYIQLGVMPTTVYDSPLPVTSPANIIALAWNDLVAPANSITWWLTGTPGSQRLVVNYSAVTGYATTGTITGQIILEEGTNNIYITTVGHDIATGAAQGLNGSGGSGVAVPGRNSVVWTATNSTYMFTPAQFVWSVTSTTGDATGGLPAGAGTPSSSNSSITAVPTATIGGTVTYQASATDPASGCVGTSEVTVTVSPAALAPIASPSSQCGQGQASLIVQADPNGSLSGTFNWYTGLTATTPVNIETTTVGISFYLTPVITTTTTYYVEFLADGNPCPSPRIPVEATVISPEPITVTFTPDPATYCSAAPQVITLTASSSAAPAYEYVWSPTIGLFEDAAMTIPYGGGNLATVYAQPTTTTTYTVTGTNYIPTTTTVLCQTTATTTVTVNPTPAAVATASPTSFCLGGTTTLTVTPNNSSALLISELTLFRGGIGATSPYPSYIGAADADFVELTNASTIPVDVSGFTLDIWTGTALLNTITFASGTIMPAGGVLVVHVGTGVDVPASLYFNTGGSNDNMFSSLATGVLLRNGSTILDAVAANSYVWPAATGVTATDWAGNAPGSGSFAGISRTAATDSNSGADWTLPSATTLQTLGTYNAVILPVATYSFLWSTGATTASFTATPATAGTYSYTVTVTATNGCTASATATYTANPIPTAPAASNATYCGVATRNIIATSTTGGSGIFTWYDQVGTLVYTEGTALAPVSSSTYSSIISSTRNFFVTYTENGCTSPQTQVTITVDIAATVSIGASPTTASCATLGTPYTLTASSTDASYVYTWQYGSSTFTGNPLVFTPIATTTVTVTGNNTATGCSNIAIYTVSITPAPSGTATAAPSAVCSGSDVALGVQLASGTVSVTSYCTSAAQFATFTDNIANVTFAGINNNSTNYPAGGALNNASANQLYTNYTSVAPAVVLPGSTYPFSVTQYQTNGYYGTYTTVYFDWDHNNTFDAAETYNIGNTASAGTAITANITVPLTAMGGLTLMRVKMVEGGAAGQSSCGTFSYGEVEDYTVLVNPYTYSWTASTTGDAVAGLPAGAGTASGANIAVTATPTATTGGTVTYTVLLTDGSTGCTNTSSVVVTVNPLPLPPSVPNPTICGAGSATLTTVAVAAPGGIFTWYDAATGGTVLQTDGTTAAPVTSSSYTTPTVTASTSYWVTFTDANGCTSSARQVDVTVTAADPVEITAVGTNPQCSASLSSVTLTAANIAAVPTNNYAYTWSTGETGATITVNPTATTTYTVTASDALTSCSYIATYTVTINTSPALVASASDNTLCLGESAVLTALVDNIAVGATPTYCTATANGSAGDFIANVTLGSINNTSTATGGPTYYNDFTAQSTTLVSGGTYTISLQVGTWASSNYIGAWIDFNNNGVFTDAGEQVALSGSLAGSAIFTATFTVPVVPSGTVRMRVREVYNITATPCNNPNPAGFGETEDYSIVISGSDYTFAWSNGVTNAVQTVTPPLGTNDYIVTVTSTNGCVSTASTSVVVSPLPVASVLPSTATINCTTPTATLVASGGGTYLWNTAETTASISATVAGTYTVVVTSADGCTASASSVVSGSTTPPTVNGGPDRVLTCTTSSATLTAVSPTTGATFVWSNGTTTTAGASITVTAAGTYTVVATDPGNSCTASDVVVVTANQTAPTLSLNTPAVLTCATTSTTITATTNATQILWSNSATTASISVSTPGTYNVTVTNPANGCTATAGVSVTQDITAPPASVSPSSATLTCATPATALTASGGGTYLWNNGSTAATISVATAGTYTVTVTGANGCTATASAAILSDIAAPVFDLGADVVITCTTPSYTFTAAGGGTYLWSTAETTASIVASAAGTYSVTVTGTNGCTTSDVVVVTADVAAPAVNLGPDQTLTCSVTSINLFATGGGTYSWSTGATTTSIVASTTGTYSVTVTGANGCTSSDSVVIGLNTTAPAVIITGTTSVCAGSSLVLTASGGSSYTWSGPGGFTFTGAVMTRSNTTLAMSGTYTVTVTGSNGCTASASAVVTITQCCAAQGGVITVSNTLCPGDPIVATVSGQNADAVNYAFYYLLVNSTTGAIVASNTTGNFAGTAPGGYLVYGYSVKISSPVGGPNPPANGTLITAITGSCFDLSNTGAAVNVPPPFPPFVGSSSPSQGTSGGTTPYAYNTQVLTLSGGTLPYNFTWNNTGYVRYDIAYSNGGATITIIYADNAQWAVTVTDSNGCGASQLSFSNATSVTPNTLLDIDSYSITGQSSTTAPNGTVSIVVSGGGCSTGQYTFQWSGPNGYTATTQNISGLVSGWYTVTVTCPLSGQTTTGWYWVPTIRRGRTKTDFAELSAFPNPFEARTNVEFSAGGDGHVQVVVFSIDGKQITTLYDGDITANEIYTVPFEANNLPSGVYVVKLTMDNGTVQTTRLVLTK